MNTTDMYLANKEIKRRISYGSGNETPKIVGSWKQSGQVSHGGFKIVRETGEPVCVCPSSVKLDTEIKEANARLITAAPDLLNACNRALPIIESLYLDNEPGMLQLRDQIQAAITKAEGQ